MANLKVKDADAADKYLAASGAGTDIDPHIVEKEVTQGTHDDLNCNANLQIGDADAANGNPVPVSALLDTDTALGAWSASTPWDAMILGAISTAPLQPWHGWLGPLVLWPRALPLAEVTKYSLAG